MKVYQSNLAIIVAAAASSSVTAFPSFPDIASRRHHVATTAKTQFQFQLPMAYGLPDEGLPDAPEDVKQDSSSVADDTLKSLTEKLNKSSQSSKLKSKSSSKKDNKSMAFLKKIGRVGGAANKNFVNAVGSDEGSTGRQPPAERGSGVGVIAKSKQAYRECTESGCVDDLSDGFPLTSSGNEWRGITDRVMGGLSNGLLRREMDLEGRPANVLEGHVSLANNGGFLQMVTDLPLDATNPSVDASDYDGIEFDILYRAVDQKDTKAGTFNMHVRTPGTLQQASYRHTFQIKEPNTWEIIRVPFSTFKAYGGGPDMAPILDASELRRIGIVGVGREMDIFLAMGGLRFYNVF